MPSAHDLAIMCRAATPEASVVEVVRDEQAPHGGVLVQVLDPVRRMTISWEASSDHGTGWTWAIGRGGFDVSSGPLTMPEDLGFALCELLGLPAPWASRLAQLRDREGLSARVAMAMAGDPWGLVECGRALSAL